MRESKVLVALMLLTGATMQAAAQDYDVERPAVSASATGRVEIPADYAALTLGVLVQDSTPTLAAAGMDARLRAITDTLLRLGFPAESLPTTHYHVTPNRDRVRIIGYTANAAVRLTIWDISRIPTVIEAALSTGATDVTGLSFGASDESEARDEALRQAVAKATRDARVLAAAAGGGLGEAIELTTHESSGRMARSAAGYMDVARSMELSADITPGAIIVEATVNARWAIEGQQDGRGYSEVEREAVLATVQQFFDAIARHDADLGENSVLLDGQYFRLREFGDSLELRRTPHTDFVSGLSAGENRGYLERMWEPMVLQRGRMAVVWTPYDFHIGGEFSHCGIDAFNLIRTDGGWKIAGIIYTVEATDCAPSPLGPPGGR